MIYIDFWSIFELLKFWVFMHFLCWNLSFSPVLTQHEKKKIKEKQFQIFFAHISASYMRRQKASVRLLRSVPSPKMRHFFGGMTFLVSKFQFLFLRPHTTKRFWKALYTVSGRQIGRATEVEKKKNSIFNCFSVSKICFNN